MQLRVKEIKANLPLEDSQIIVSVEKNDGRIPLHETLNCPPSDQCVLMPELAAIILPSMEFTIDHPTRTEHQLYELYVLAVSNSNSKVVFLGSVTVDVPQLYYCSFQNRTSITFTKHLQHVQNQKGSIIYQLTFAQLTQNPYNHFRQKSSESLDQQETSSSDSFDDNLKELNKTLDSDNSNNSPNAKTPFSLYNQRNADFSQNIIVEEIDLEDSECQPSQNFQLNSKFTSNSSIKQAQQKNQYPKSKYDQKNIKQRLMQQKLNIQKYLNRLEEWDHFLFSLQQRLKYFKE